MKRLILFFTVTLIAHAAFCQQNETNNKKEIEQVLITFMDCIKVRDSVKFYSLFHTEPITWVGVFKEKSYQDISKKDRTRKDFFGSSYQEFYNDISNMESVEEKFYNIEITNDENIASVTFNYSFWENGKKINWGKENWGLVKANGHWKITSVIFSMEFESIIQEPINKTN